MEFFQNIILPAFVAFILVFGLIKKVPVFSVFTQGAKTALSQTGEILPALTALTVAVSMLEKSGGIDFLSELLSPVAEFFKIPSEVLPLCIISPLSGSGSIAVLEDILTKYSPDSYIGRVACVIAGASETTFYAVAVYYSSVGITRFRHTVPACLTADFVSFIAAAFFCR